MSAIGSLKHIKEKIVKEIYGDIKRLIDNSRENIYQTVNTEMIKLYWSIGKRIMDIQH